MNSRILYFGVGQQRGKEGEGEGEKKGAYDAVAPRTPAFPFFPDVSPAVVDMKGGGGRGGEKLTPPSRSHI